MSQENVEIFKRGIAAFNRGDVEGVLETADSEVEWRPVLQVLIGGTATVYRGHDGVRRIVRDLDSAFAEIEIQIADIRDLGDAVLGLGRVFGRSKQGVEVDEEYGIVIRYRNGLSVWGRDWYSHTMALEAAGLSE